MKWILEFGERRTGARMGIHVDNRVCANAAQAVSMATALCAVFAQDVHVHGGHSDDWPTRNCSRLEWASKTHFVAISRVGRLDGPAAAYLWREDYSPVILSNVITKA